MTPEEEVALRHKLNVPQKQIVLNPIQIHPPASENFASQVGAAARAFNPLEHGPTDSQRAAKAAAEAAAPMPATSQDASAAAQPEPTEAQQGGMQVSGPRYQTVGASFQKGRYWKGDDFVKKELELADQGEAAAKAHIDVERETADTYANLMNSAADSENEAMVARQSRMVQHERDRRRKLNEIKTAQDQYADGKIEQKHAWSSATGEQKAGFFLAALAGGWLQGAGKTGSNPGIDALNTYIERDIKSQQEKKDRQRQLLGQARASLGDESDMYASDMHDMALMRGDRLASLEYKAKQLAAQAVGKEAKAKYLDIATQIGQQRLAILADPMMHTFVPEHTVQVGGGGGFVPMDESTRERTVVLPGGQVAVFNRKESAAKYEEKTAESLALQSVYDQALAIRANASEAELLNPRSSVHQKLKGLEMLAATKGTVHEGQGAMSEGDKEVRIQAQGSFTQSKLTGNADDVIRQARGVVGKTVALRAQASGGELAEKSYMMNPKTNSMVPAIRYTGESLAPRPSEGSSKFRGAGK